MQLATKPHPFVIYWFNDILTLLLTDCVCPTLQKANLSLKKANQSYPLLPLRGVSKQDFKHAFNLNLSMGFSLRLNSKVKAEVKQLVKPKKRKVLTSTCLHQIPCGWVVNSLYFRSHLCRFESWDGHLTFIFTRSASSDMAEQIQRVYLLKLYIMLWMARRGEVFL